MRSNPQPRSDWECARKTGNRLFSAQDIVEAKAWLATPKGRPATIDRDAVGRLLADGISPAEVARRLGISRTQV
ncbi:MAG: helix-turn-helix domain-containing protein [Alphaproteobacteria bacterium]|nr:helix-turn-helix domain-containing protein [Alphaproteobacteria bacterium]